MAVKTIPISEVRQKLKDILATLEATGEPYLITQQKAILASSADLLLVEASLSSVAPAFPSVTSSNAFRPVNQ